MISIIYIITLIMIINSMVIICCLENTGGTLKHLSSVAIHNVLCINRFYIGVILFQLAEKYLYLYIIFITMLAEVFDSYGVKYQAKEFICIICFYNKSVT